MSTQNAKAKEINEVLDFYYFAYSKLVSFPFLYYELVPNQNESNCTGKNTTQHECDCCAMQENDLKYALTIYNGETVSDIGYRSVCCFQRLYTDYYSRKNAESLDIDYMPRNIELLLSQFYIICVVLAKQKQNYDTNEACMQSLRDSLTRCVSAKKHCKTTVKEKENDKIILQCLTGELLAQNQRDNPELTKLIALLNEARHCFADLHRNGAGFMQMFSNKIYVINEPDRIKFDCDT